MWARAADTFAPGDSFGVSTTTDASRSPVLPWRFNAPNVLLGAAALLAVLWVTHHLGKGR